MAVVELNGVDRRIWREELDAFVPMRVFDAHNHLTRGEFDLATENRCGALGGVWALLEQGVDTEMLDAADALLMPGRQVDRLLLPFPHPQCNFAASNAYVARESRKNPRSAALMLVHPGMTAGEVDRAIRRDRFLGFKPYRWYSVTGDARNCRIPEYMPPHILEVGNRYGLIVGLHLSRADAIADAANLDDLERLSARYPRLRWDLFHCARSYSSWAIERAAPRLRQIANVWFDGSSVCEADAFDALFAFADPRRVCYGSDDLAVGIARGKYLTFGYAWVWMDEKNQTFNTDHCDGRMTLVRYEMLRAMRRAARRARFTPAQIADLFYGNAAALIQETRRDLERELGPA